MTRAAKAAGFCAVWLLILLSAAAGARILAGDGELLADRMMKYAPPERTALPAAEYPGVGRMTARYLTGREPEFQYTFADEQGNVFLCFQAHEAAHMADCRGLIRLAETVAWVCAGTAAALAGAGMLLHRRRAFARGMIAGLWGAGAVLSALLVWGLVNFDGLFVTFHRLAFSNDGWLLDPRTDLLIRLMPTELFIDLGGRVLAGMLLTALAAGAAAGVLTRKDKPAKAG